MTEAVGIYDVVCLLAVRGTDNPVSDLMLAADGVEYDLFWGFDEEAVADSAIAAGYPRGGLMRVFIEAKSQPALEGGEDDKRDSEATE